MGMIDREAIKGLQNIVEYWTLNPYEQQCAKTAISALQEREGREEGCCFCLDASIAPELDGCDLSFRSIGHSTNEFMILIRTGAGKPMAILFEQWDGGRWVDVGVYEPRFCPVCGRKLKEKS